MSDFAIKQRLNRAIKSAIKLLDQPPGSYEIILLNNHVFHIEAIRKKEIRKIRIVLDEITEEDKELVAKVNLPIVCTKEIWCKERNSREFKIVEINDYMI